MVVDAFLLSEEAQAHIGDALKDRNIAKFEGHVALGGVVEAVEYYTERPTPDILIVEFEGDGEGIKGGLETLAEVCDSGTRVVAVGAENDVALYRSLLRMGVSDYLTAPVTARQVFDVIHGLVSDPDAQPAGRVLAFVGSRGGVGSSTVAHNTAWSLSDSYDEDVGVVDLDLQYGTAALAFNLEARQGVFDVLGQLDRIDEQLLARYLDTYEDHIHVLGTSASLALPADVDGQALDALIDMLTRKFPFVVLDLPSHWGEWVGHVMAMADEAVVTSMLDLTCLRDAQNVLRQVNEDRGNDRKAWVVLNQAGRLKKTELSEKDFESVTEDRLALTMAYDPILFSTASNNGQPIGEVNARSKAAASFKELARRLSGRHVAAKRKREGPFSFLSRGK